MTTSASALPVFDMSISAGLNRSNVGANPDFPVEDSYAGTKPRVTFNASVGPLVGVELGWSELASNSTTISIVPPGGAIGGVGSIEDEIRESGAAFWLAYAPSLELGAFELTGKLGVARTSQDLVIAGFGIDDTNMETEALIGVAGSPAWSACVSMPSVSAAMSRRWA